MEENQNQSQIQNGKVSWSQDQTQKQNQDQSFSQSQNRTNQEQPPQVGNQIQQGPDQHQSRTEEETQQAHRPSPLKKKVQTTVESRRNLGPAARATAAHLNSSSGLRKAHSVQSLLTDTGESSCPTREVREVPPQLLLPLQRPTTLPSSPRRPLSVAPPPQRPSPASPRSPQQETAATSPAAPPAVTTPRKSSSSSSCSSTPATSRSYMSPTASSMAKMSRSVSMGDSLNIPESGEESAVSSATEAATATSSSQVKDIAPPPVAVVPSNAALATPPHAAVVPVVVASSSSLGIHGNQTAVGNHGNRSLQARVSGSSRPLPDKPSLASLSSAARPPPVSVSPLTLPHQEEEPHTPPPADGNVEHRDNADQPISVETCRALTNELQSCFKRATHLYRKVSGSSPDDSAPDQRQMAVVLSEAFLAMRAELDCLPLGMLGEGGGLRGVGEVKTAALLEEYSLLLLQAVSRRSNSTAH